jgi:hypothetical protein
MFVLTPRVPFAPVWGWPRGLGHPIVRLIGFVAALVMLTALTVLALLAIVIDVVTFPLRLLL